MKGVLDQNAHAIRSNVTHTCKMIIVWRWHCMLIHLTMCKRNHCHRTIMRTTTTRLEKVFLAMDYVSKNNYVLVYINWVELVLWACNVYWIDHVCTITVYNNYTYRSGNLCRMHSYFLVQGAVEKFIEEYYTRASTDETIGSELKAVDKNIAKTHQKVPINCRENPLVIAVNQ